MIAAKTSDYLIAGLSEVRRINIRRATPGQLEHIRQTAFLTEGEVSVETMEEIQLKLLDLFASYGDTKSDFPSTWKF